MLLVGQVSLFNLKLIGLGRQQRGRGESGNDKERKEEDEGGKKGRQEAEAERGQ